MFLKFRTVLLLALFASAAVCPGRAAFAAPGGSPGQSSKQSKPQAAPKPGQLPRPKALGQGLFFRRDAASGELYAAAPDSPPSDSSSSQDPGAIHSRVMLVQVPCAAAAPDGAPVRGLTAANFRLFEDGVPQQIASFDASATPASIALVIDVSPSIYRELASVRAAARDLAATLSPADEISVVSFSDQAHVILPFSTDRALLDRALDSSRLAKVEDSSESNIYQAVYLTARQLLRGRPGRRALVLLTDGQDSGLGLTWSPLSASPDPQSLQSGARPSLAFDDVPRELAADGIALFIVSTETRPRAMTPEWLAAHRNQILISSEARDQKIPLYTLYLAELARRDGGQLYFLREVGSLDEIYRRIALAINAQYTLGYYPSAGTQRPGWRALRVDLVAAPQTASSAAPAGAPPPDVPNSISPNAAPSLAPNIPPGTRLIHRDSYYLSAFP